MPETETDTALAARNGVEPYSRLEALYHLSQALYAIHDLDNLLRFATEQLILLLEAEGAAVLLLDPERNEFYFRVAEHLLPGAGERFREIRFSADLGIAGWVLRTGKPAAVADVSRDPRFYAGVDERSGLETRSYLCAPLRRREKIIGVVTAVNRRQRPFDEESVRFLEAIASQLALGIENAQLVEALRAAQEKLQEENRYLRHELRYDVRFENLVGGSAAMKEVYRLIEQVVDTNVTVLLVGETGTGKDLLARALHANGPRRNGPFVAVNCAAIPETLLEAELFGYEKGAFTGAAQRKRGRFELAGGGTLFLDEVGELSPLLQAKLLRFLQDKSFERLGGTDTLKSDARIIAATNRDLEQLIAERKFREDLFYRLNVYPIPIPPLRERKEDLLALASHFLAKSSAELGKPTPRLSAEAHDLLARYDWPGNVRELENVIERAILLCRGDTIAAAELPLSLRESPRRAPAKALDVLPAGLPLPELEKQLIQRALEETNYNKSRASRLLGLSRTQLRTRIKQYGLERRPRA